MQKSTPKQQPTKNRQSAWNKTKSELKRRDQQFIRRAKIDGKQLGALIKALQQMGVQFDAGHPNTREQQVAKAEELVNAYRKEAGKS